MRLRLSRRVMVGSWCGKLDVETDGGMQEKVTYDFCWTARSSEGNDDAMSIDRWPARSSDISCKEIRNQREDRR